MASGAGAGVSDVLAGLTVPLLLVLLVVGVAVVVSYNRFVRQRTLVDQAWSGIDVELGRRHDLVPNLVETVRGYAAHEREVLEALTVAREEARRHVGETPHEREAAEDRVGFALDRVMVRSESYPDLRASAAFLQLQDALTMTEDRIAASRRFYNGNVRALNTRCRTFPSNLVASAFGFAERDYFELHDPRHRELPDLGLS